MMLRSLRQAREVVARGKPSRDSVDDPDAFEHIAISGHGHLGWRVAVPARGRVSDLIQGRCRRRRGRVRGHPMPERIRTSHGEALIDEVPVDDVPQIEAHACCCPTKKRFCGA